jgi:DNA uptake protein ComE-like DNA-binding protein
MKLNRTLLGSVLALGLIGGSFAQKTTPPATTPPAPTMAATTCSIAAVNVNTVTQAELEKVPGLGPKLAAAVIAARPFKDEAELGTKNIVKFRPCFLYK